MSSRWVTLHGHARLAIAVARQAAELAQVIFAGFTNEPAVRASYAAGAPSRSSRADAAARLWHHCRRRGGGSKRGYNATLANRLRAFFLERGLLIRPLGSVVYRLPPYCIGSEELRRACSAIEEAAATLR